MYADSNDTTVGFDRPDVRAQTLDQWLPQVYDELHAVAARYLSQERRDHTLQPTALIHEVFVKLSNADRLTWNDRGHFLATAAAVMRHVLVNHARARRTTKRGGDRIRLSMDEAAAIFEARSTDLLVLDEALEKLAAMDRQQARIVELRFFGGLTVSETAEALHLAVRTVEREWSTARAWLRREIESRLAE